MKDWPMTLKRNAAICELAKALYRARGEVYGGSTELIDQPTHIRAQYITKADELLQTVAPGRLITVGLWPTHAPIAGVIEPKEGGKA